MSKELLLLIIEQADMNQWRLWHLRADQFTPVLELIEREPGAAVAKRLPPAHAIQRAGTNDSRSRRTGQMST